MTDSADRLKALNQIKQPNQLNDEVIHVAQLSNFSLPTDAVAWEMADYIILDEFVLADLADTQQQALIDYVKTGGNIVIGASANLNAEVGKLRDYLPLTLETTTQTLTADNMRALTANNTLTNDVTVYHSTLNDGATSLFKMDETILAGKQQ